MPNGKIKWFNEKKGIGFIKPDDEDKDIFVQAKFLDNKTIDFTSIRKKDLIWNLKVNKVRYDLYKYNYTSMFLIKSRTIRILKLINLSV